MEFIKMITMLCSISSAPAGVMGVDEIQMLCHSYYAECVETKPLTQCMKDRPKAFHVKKTYAPHNEHLKSE